MADTPGAQAALAVEAVEWAPDDRDKLTIRVRGRWRRRRPGWRGQPTLVIEADGTRHRFPAIPEPPSLAGAPPGAWQMTFSIPTWLEPYLGGQIWLQLGLAIVPLPAPVGPSDAAAVAAVGPDDAAAVGPDDEMLVDRRARTAEMAALRARERQADAEVVVAEVTIRLERLERELEHARREPERLRRLLAERDQQRRAADQRAHAEQALRLELVQELEGRPRAERAQTRIEAGELATAEARIRDLEQELERVRRQADEAEQLAAAARPPAAVSAPAPVEPRPFDLRQELAVALRRRPARVAALPPPPERLLASATAAERRALRRERELVAPRKPLTSPASPASPPAASADELELTATLADLRAELDELTEIAERESAAREAAQLRVGTLERRVAELEQALRERDLSSARAYDAVHELRTLLGQARVDAPAALPPSADPQPASEPSELEPERFDAALSRLRASAPPEPEQGEPPDHSERAESLPPPAKPWLHPVLKRVTARDPVTAGRLLIGLLPAQGALHSAAIAYDLVLGEGECIQVTLGDPPATAQIVRAEEPRAQTEVAFRVTGGYAELARLVFGGRLRGRLRRGGARVIGDRRAARALIGFDRAQLGLDQLYAAGASLDPTLAFMLAAAMVEPRWTVGERFTIAHESGVPTEQTTYLHIRRGERLTVSDAPPLGPVAATIVCSADLVLAVLAGELQVDATIRGDSASVLALLGWLERAQRG